jgi:hypothetical protein
LAIQPEDNEHPSVHYERGVPILDVGRVNEIERKQAEAEGREREQISLNRSLVRATVALVICTLALGGVQSFYMHRQWKLTSDGLSKMGDQIWAAKDAALAARQSANTSSDILRESKGQFDKTLNEIKRQTSAQREASGASLSSANTAKEALHVSERAYLVREKVEAEVDHKVITASVENAGHIPTGDIHVVTHLAVVEQVALAPEGRVRILEADRTESDLPSFPPGIPQKVYFTPQTFDVDRYRMGIQTLVVILTVTYNDGFPDEPDRTLKICAQSDYHPQINMTDFVACNFNASLEKLTKWESDPNPRVVHQQQPTQSEH